MRKIGTRIYLLNICELLEAEPDGTLYAEAAEKLDAVRRQRAERCMHEQSKAACVGAGLLLQLAVQEAGTGRKLRQESGDGAGLPMGEEKGADIPEELTEYSCSVRELLQRLHTRYEPAYVYGKNGKPYFRDYPFYFNISHSGDYVLCVISEEEVGADIQKIQPVDTAKLAGRFFAKEECRMLEQCGSDGKRQSLFFELWTKKEAFGKLTGQGVAAVLGMCIPQPETAGKPERGVCRPVEAWESGKSTEPPGQSLKPAGEWRLKWLEITVPEGYVAAVCTENGKKELQE